MIKNIIFDWSGTLNDDLYFSYKAAMKVFERIGIENITLEEFKKEFILPYMDFYKKYKKDPDKRIINDVFNREMKLINRSKLFPEAKETLIFLKENNINMIIISSYLSESLRKEVVDSKIYEFFSQINGSVLDKVKAIKEIVSKNGFNPKNTLFVGDMVHDIEAGKTAGIKIVSFSGGYQFKEDLIKEKPDYVIDNLRELKKIIISQNSRK